MLYLPVELPAALSVQKHEDDSEISGDGQAAFKDLCDSYNKATDEVTRATMEELMDTTMEPGENPDDYFNQKHLLRSKAQKMGEVVSDRWFKDICIKGFTEDYNDIKMMVYRDPTFDISQIQSTMRHMFLDAQSRNGTKGRIAGRGVAMAADTPTERKRAGVICHKCHEEGHIRRNCPKNKGKQKQGAGGGSGKFCSVHKSTTHSDDKCYSQGAKRPEKTPEKANAFSSCAQCTHCSVGGQQASTEKPAIDFTVTTEEFDRGLVFTSISMAGRKFTPDADRATLFIDSGASNTFLDPEIIPGLQDKMMEYRDFEKPMPIETAGDNTIFGTATGIVHCTVQDSNRDHLPVHLRAMVVPGIGRSVFSPTEQLKSGVNFILEAGNPRLEVGGSVVPLKQERKDQGMCSLDIAFKEIQQDKPLGKPANSTDDEAMSGVAYASKTSADTWHRRLGHLNPRSMELLRKKDGNGVDYTDTVSDCDICAVAKSRQLDHPKKSMRKTSGPMELAYTDLMGPITPASKGGHK